MLKFIKHHLSTIDGIEIFPLISLTIFVIFFAVLLIGVYRTPKKRLNEISRMPLD